MDAVKTISIVVLMALLGLTSCDKDGRCIDGEGAVVTKNLSVGNFNRIDFSIAGDVVISQGDAVTVSATGHGNIIDRIETGVSNNKWEIDFERGCYDEYELTINITVPDLKSIVLDGSGTVVVNDFRAQTNLDLSIPGSGSILMKKFDGTENFDVNISGSGSVMCNSDFANLKVLDIKISGSGSFDGFDVSTDECYVNIPGSGNCKVNVRNKLDVDINGSGTVHYKGNPSISKDVNAAGHVIDVN